MGREVVAVAIKILLGVVFVGWLMIWMMWPTNTYSKSWSPKLQERTISTYFGSAGKNILIYAFPILFIAVFGCVYLHLEQKRNSNSNMQSGKPAQTSRLVFWKRPLLLRGPLGIVSATEVAFFLMFMALVIWSFSAFLYTGFSVINAHNSMMMGQHMSESKLQSAALRLGLVGNMCLAFLFFPVTRGSSLLPLVGLTSESSIRYHIWLGHITLTFFAAHSFGYIAYWGSTSQISQMVKWAKTGASNVSGELSMLCGLVMWVMTFPRIRRKAFELFFYTHHLYALFIIFFAMHVGIGHFYMILPGVHLFLVDRYLRFLQSRQKAQLLSARLLPGETVELNFSKSPGLQYTATSIVFVNVPSVSKLQWHPFTVTTTSGLEPEKLSVVIKKEGSWSQKLYHTLSSPSPPDRIDVSVEGPYGPISNNFQSYGSLILVSGGSGITPFISIIRELIHRSTTLNLPTPNVQLICAFRNSADLNMLDLLLPISGATADSSHLHLQIHAFVTREKEQTMEARKHIRTIWFKPSASDSPISPALGPNNWLWLAIIIATSFISFLLILGITNRYYIYPIDRNTNNVFAYAPKALLNLLFLSTSVAAMAGVAVMWNKRHAAMEGERVQSMDVPTPTISPVSWFYNADRELESLPTESLVQATKVQYGSRPDLKKMLLEFDGSNTGVFVSGPTAMRREVAAICSSGLAENLHFESVSFSW